MSDGTDRTAPDRIGHEGTPDRRRTLDKHVAPLVYALNKLPGVETTGSCQGHHDNRFPYVSLTCAENDLWLLLKAINAINSREPRQVRTYLEVLAYGEGQVDAVIRFHHLIVRVAPTQATVREWHRRIREMTDLIAGELQEHTLSGLRAPPAFGKPEPFLRLKDRAGSSRRPSAGSRHRTLSRTPQTGCDPCLR